jgi:UPF0755 protein
LKPAQTKELFFVADGKGGHVFAETLKDHNANVAKWKIAEQEILARRAAAQTINAPGQGAPPAPATPKGKAKAP